MKILKKKLGEYLSSAIPAHRTYRHGKSTLADRLIQTCGGFRRERMIAPDKSRRRALPMISIMPCRLSRVTRSLGHERPGSRARRTTALGRASPLRGERGKVRLTRV